MRLAHASSALSEPMNAPQTPGEAFAASRLVETTSAWVAISFRLLAVNLRWARNLYETPAILASSGAGARTAPDRKGRPVIDVERDGRIGLDLKFGTISFKEEAAGTFAVALVDVLVGASDLAPERDTRVQMNVKIPADPQRETVLEVTERFRSHIVATLRAAADALDAQAARDLLFHGSEIG